MQQTSRYFFTASSAPFSYSSRDRSHSSVHNICINGAPSRFAVPTDDMDGADVGWRSGELACVRIVHETVRAAGVCQASQGRVVTINVSRADEATRFRKYPTHRWNTT